MTDRVPLRILLFGVYRERAGAPAIEVELPAGARVDDLLAGIRELPELQGLPDRVAVAVNRRYADGDSPLGPDDEIAIIPPVAGG
jgi:molybdopterin converting factor subunit 1